MDDQDLLGTIDRMVASEHDLRDGIQRGVRDPEAARVELRQLQDALDQCWDLLRQRRAHEEFDQDADEARARPVSEIKSYWA